MGPRALMNIGQMLCHGSIFPAHEKLLQIGDSSLSCHPPKSKKKEQNKQKTHTLNSHHPVVCLFHSYLFSVCIVIEGLAFEPCVVEPGILLPIKLHSIRILTVGIVSGSCLDHPVPNVQS